MEPLHQGDILKIEKIFRVNPRLFQVLCKLKKLI